MLATRTLFQPRVRERPPAKPLAIYLKSNLIIHAGAVSGSWWFSALLRPFRSGPHVRRRLASRVEATFSSAFTIEGARPNIRLVKFSLHLVWFIEKRLENIKGTSMDIVLLGFAHLVHPVLRCILYVVCRIALVELFVFLIWNCAVFPCSVSIRSAIDDLYKSGY
jgi:hypothetical protein